MTELQPLRVIAAALWQRLTALHRAQRGYSTEAVVVTAALAALAIAVTTIIAIKVTQQAQNLQTR